MLVREKGNGNVLAIYRIYGNRKKKALLAPKSEEDMECGIHKAGILY